MKWNGLIIMSCLCFNLGMTGILGVKFSGSLDWERSFRHALLDTIHPLHITGDGSTDPARIEGINMDNNFNKVLMVNDQGIIRYKEFCCSETMTPILDGTGGDLSWIYTDESGNQYEFSVDTIGTDTIVFDFNGSSINLFNHTQWRDTICDCKSSDLNSPSYILNDVGINISRPSEALDVLGKQQIDDGSENIYITTRENIGDRFSQSDNLLLGSADTVSGQSKNIIIGKMAGSSMLDNNILLGYKAGKYPLGSDNIALGRMSLTPNALSLPVSVSNNIAIGVNSLSNSFLKLDGNIAIGERSATGVYFRENNMSAGGFSFFGAQLLDRNSAFGYQAGLAAEQLSDNLLLGAKSGFEYIPSAGHTIQVSETAFDINTDELNLSSDDINILLNGILNIEGQPLGNGDRFSLYIDSDCSGLDYGFFIHEENAYPYEIVDLGNGKLKPLDTDILSACSGTYDITVQFNRFSISESTALGYNARIEHSKQLVLGQEENDEVKLNGFLKLNSSFPIDGTGVDNGSLFKGVDGNLYWKDDGGTVTQIN